MVSFLALMLLQVETRTIGIHAIETVEFLGGGLIGAQSGSTARQNRKPSFNER
jgi:hypothetical protein